MFQIAVISMLGALAKTFDRDGLTYGKRYHVKCFHHREKLKCLHKNTVQDNFFV